MGLNKIILSLKNIIFLILNVIFRISVSNADVCYADIGCFSSKFPWISLSRPFPSPESPEDVNVTLTFFSREQTAGQFLNIYPNITFNVTGFAPNRRTVTITHGFASSSSADWVQEMKDKYLENMDANVFLVNWEKGANGINYFQAAANTRVVGAILGRFGKYLIQNQSVSYSDFHMIGHSLGAHTTGYAAKSMNDAATNGQKVFRITGLDAAQPGFQGLSGVVRLNTGDASFVETIHSDAKPFIPFFGFGYLTQLGDVDFYLNKGYDQPKCIDIDPIRNLTSINQLANISVEVISKAVSCSHGRSYEIFTSSIDPAVKCAFIGHRLITRVPITSNQASCGLMGRDCIRLGLDTPNQTPRGSFQIMTSGKKPYCCYKYSTIKGCRATP